MIQRQNLQMIFCGNQKGEVLNLAKEVFTQAVNSGATSPYSYVKDITSMGLPQNVINGYCQLGMNVLQPVIASKKKLSGITISPIYALLTGLLSSEFVIGCDLTRDMNTAIYTASKPLLEQLHTMGAFDNEEKYQKNMKALFGDGKTGFGNKVLSSLEKNSIAMARIDVAGVIGDQVSLDLIIPSKFREDYGTTFKLYPYSVFPFVTQMIGSLGQNQKGLKAVTIMQAEPDGNVKTRKVVFTPTECQKVYFSSDFGSPERKEEALIMFNNNMMKTTVGWDPLKLYMKAYNVEASLYGAAYSGIRLERILRIVPCTMDDIDRSEYLVDFDNVRRLFRARVNRWNIPEFQEFNKICDTESCANKADRIQMINSWANSMRDSDLFKVMKMKRNLFETNSGQNHRTIEEGLEDMYRRTPSAAKRLEYTDLEFDPIERKKQVKELLRNGICQIECVSTKTGASRKYIATSNESVLNTAYGIKQRLAYESPRESIRLIKGLIDAGKITTMDKFVEHLNAAEIDGMVDYSTLGNTPSTNNMKSALDTTLSEIEAKSNERSSSDNVYVVNFRRINADSKEDYYGSVDVRNITSLEYGKQK